MSSQKGPSTAVVVALTVIAVTAIAAVALVVIAVDKSELPEGWLGLFLTMIGSLVTAVVTLAKLDKVEKHTTDLTNGAMDAKIRAGVADVLQDRFIDPNTADQIAQDRAARDNKGS